MSRQDISDYRLTLMGFKPSYALLETSRRTIMHNNSKAKLRLKAEKLKMMKQSEVYADDQEGAKIKLRFKKLIRESAVESYIFSRQESEVV
jgi:hypothetical protein